MPYLFITCHVCMHIIMIVWRTRLSCNSGTMPPLLSFMCKISWSPFTYSYLNFASQILSSFLQTHEYFNGRSTVNRLLWWLWLVRKDRGNCGEQNPSGGVIGNKRNRGELKQGFCDFYQLRSSAFRMLYGDKNGMEMTGIARASDRYQPWPVE